MEVVLILSAVCYIAAFAPDPIIRWCLKPLHQTIDKYDTPKNDIEELRKIPRVMGWVERPMFVLAMYLNFATFICVWLTLKAAGGLGPWNPKSPKLAHVGRAKFMTNMIGSGLSIGAAVLLALFARWLIKN